MQLRTFYATHTYVEPNIITPTCGAEGRGREVSRTQAHVPNSSLDTEINIFFKLACQYYN
jgi:hypothetical protein